jgi:hypothetical protein
LRPEFDISALFPAREEADEPTELELSVFAAFWDDEESEAANLGAIAWWLEQAEAV